MADSSPPSDVQQASSDEHGAGVGFYETDDGMVFYDTDNPLAWIQARAALPVERMR
jgi:hypothetical protein